VSGWLIGIVTVIYLGVTISFLYEGKPGMAVAFFGYALANLGLIWASGSH
jgi:hypothetical protein